MAIKKKLRIGNNIIDKNNPFIIAEIGHNHQGSTKRAKDLILARKNAGASAVKFQKETIKHYLQKNFTILLTRILIALQKHMEIIEIFWNFLKINLKS